MIVEVARTTRETGRPESRWAILLHLGALLAICALVFPNNAALMFVGYDGKYNLMKIALQMNWMAPGLNFGSNYLQEMGNIFMAHNVWLLPGYVVGGLMGDGIVGVTAVYTINTVIGFLAVWILGRVLSFRTLAVYLAAWSFVLLAMPFLQTPPLYPITGMVPHYLQLISIPALMIACFVPIGRGGQLRSVILTVAILVLGCWTTAAMPAPFSISAPFLGLFGFTFIVRANPAERKAKLLAILALLVASAPGIIPFLAGTMLYSVPAIFRDELVTFLWGWNHVAMVFDGGVWWFGPYFFALALVGCLVSLVWATRDVNGTAIATLVGVGLLMLGGLAVNTVVTPFIAFRDFEIFLWPFYALFAGVSLERFLAGARAMLVARVDFFGEQKIGRTTLAIPTLFPAAIVATTSLMSSSQGNCSTWRYPPQPSGPVGILERETSLTSSSVFRGMVATFTGYQSSPSPVSWIKMIGLDNRLHGAVGNDFRAHGLWYFGIPTLFGYNQLMTPQFYLVASRLLARRVDRQMRNVIVLTRPNPDYLQALGVRFLITDFPAQEQIPEARLRFHFPVRNIADLWLYELPNPNLGTYSPTRIVPFGRAAEAIDRLKDNFDFRDSVLLEGGSVSASLTSAEAQPVTLSKSGLRVRAHSPGTSLLLLPLQFSHCLDIDLHEGDTKTRIVRANLMQAGLIFTKNVDATIRFSYGPFHNPYCRIRDSIRFANLVRDLPRRVIEKRTPSFENQAVTRVNTSGVGSVRNYLLPVRLKEGKWYWEVHSSNLGMFQGKVAATAAFGVASKSLPETADVTSVPGAWGWRADGVRIRNGKMDSFGSPVQGDTPQILTIALNADSGSLWIGVNGKWLSGDPAIAKNPALSELPKNLSPFLHSRHGSAGTAVLNLVGKATEFAYPPPAGFRPLAEAD